MGEPLDVAALLREARGHAGLTQTDLGQRTGIAQPNISAYESGRRIPTVRTLVALLDACDVELSWRARPASTRSAGALHPRAQQEHR